MHPRAPASSHPCLSALPLISVLPTCLPPLCLARLHRIWGTSQPLFRGTGVFTDSGLLPLRRPLTTVVGAPLPVTAVDPKADHAAFDAAVEELHGRYVAALRALWDEWKDRLAPERKGELTLVG